MLVKVPDEVLEHVVAEEVMGALKGLARYIKFKFMLVALVPKLPALFPPDLKHKHQHEPPLNHLLDMNALLSLRALEGGLDSARVSAKVARLPDCEPAKLRLSSIGVFVGK